MIPADSFSDKFLLYHWRILPHRIPRKKTLSERFMTFRMKARGFPLGDIEIQEEVKAVRRERY